MQRGYLLLLILLTLSKLAAQDTCKILGKIIDATTQYPLVNVIITVQNSSISTLTDSNGFFSIENCLVGKQLVYIKTQGYKDSLIQLDCNPGKIMHLGLIPLEEDYILIAGANTITFLESEINDDNNITETTSGLLQSARDVFLQAAAFNWGQARFKLRGLDSEHASLLINGVPMNKIYDGRPQWNNWGGLNDVLRNQEFTVGTAAANYTFGGILGSQQISTQASTYRKGARITFSGSNTQYHSRFMANYASGMQESGWAYAFAIGARHANEGYFEGTTFSAQSLFLSIEKKLSENQSLNLTGFYTPSSRGKNSANTYEATQLNSEKYNSYWGYQEGEKRNARVKKVSEPLIMVNHNIQINPESTLRSSIAYQFGTVGNSNIDYQNAPSPDPTYYKKLPSYFSSMYASDNGEFSGEFQPDLENATKSLYKFQQNPQIIWDDLYRANQKPILNNDNKIIGYEPQQSKYVVYEDRVDDLTGTFTSNLQSKISENISLDAGVTFQKLKSTNYQKLLDLLGGSYFNDLDYFYKGDAGQSDLNHPNRQVLVGDTYGYNYKLFATKLEGFTQLRLNYKKVDLFIANSYTQNIYQREGLFKNGLYPENSFGRSTKKQFENFGIKGGFTFKISGNNLIILSGAHLTKAPTLRNTFANARINNEYINQLDNENCSSLEAHYVYKSPTFKLRLTTYYNTLKNSTKTSFFYAEGIFDNGAGYGATDAFVTQHLTNVNTKNLGTELGIEYQVTSTFKINSALAIGHYVYTDNPEVLITNDANATNDLAANTFNFGKAAMKNYKVAGMPQRACSIGLEYRAPSYWWIAANGNLLSNQYLDISPISRTSQFYINPANNFPFPEASVERGNYLLQQEKFNATTLFNLTAGKSWRVLKKNINLFISVNNLLDTIYKTGGFEQARNANFRELNQDVSSKTPSFGPKYYYGYGRTYFANLAVTL